MKTCWQILDISQTTDVDIIRRAYLALLPSFHPETDPQGFKQLRQAYEDALRIAQSPAKSVWQPEEHEVAEHEILLAFRALLASDSERFLPSAWQRFIQQLNYCSMEEIDELRWSLCTIAMNTAHLSFECVVLLAERLRWLQEENTGEIDEEELESFLYAIAKGNVFNFQTILHLPVAVQNDTIDFYQMFARIWSSHPEWLTLYLAQHRAVIIPDDAKLHRNLLRWYSASRLGIPELLDYARSWREAEPDNEDARYYEYAQRVYCGGKPLLYVPGDSARTRFHLYEILSDEKLSALGRSLVEMVLHKGRKPRISLTRDTEHPLWPLYLVAKQLVQASQPTEESLMPIVSRLDAEDRCPLEALIIRRLLIQAANFTEKQTVEPEPQPQPMPVDDGGPGCLGVIKIIFYIFIFAGLIGKILHLFG
ncbi:TPA: J domain-containing protein [Escherichia coli]|uniref:DnaJ-class chaperone n=2 Tax=Escherichia coli TaxID=562 RepID=A0A447XBQ4_ECOLX|nr:J domain-containing protein [Escherichia coli]EEV8231764.1 J domain-containing protein [Escherichia coli]EFD0981913.1 J domain-containing protein [Escherichia coli]EFF2319065.1 J domain-containing protein [Escherichia coli]EFL6605602.1 J domain-containing protein [Escherichia coli]EFN9972508.1 J domain-containing protein [Escherichia coli]